MSAGAEGLLGRTETVLSCDVECVLYKGVLERVKGDDPKTPTGPEERYGGLQPATEALQLVVDLDAEGLKGSGGGMNPLGPEAAGNGLLDQLPKLLGGGHRASSPLPDNGPGDRGGEPLLAVGADQGGQIDLVPAVEEGGRGLAGRGLVHPHVERAVLPEAEAAGGIVELK